MHPAPRSAPLSVTGYLIVVLLIGFYHATPVFAAAPARPEAQAPGSHRPIKSLKRTALETDQAIWDVSEDAVDKDGDGRLSLTHRASDSLLSLIVAENYEDTRGMSVDVNLLHLFSEVRKDEPGLRAVALPKGFVPPAKSRCKAMRARTGQGKEAYSMNYIFCLAFLPEVWVNTSLIYVDALKPRQLADINRLLSSMTIRPTSGATQEKANTTSETTAAPPAPRLKVNVDMRDIDIRDFLYLYFGKNVSVVISPTVSGKINYQAVDKAWGDVLQEVLDLHQLDFARFENPKPVIVIGRTCEMDFMRQEYRGLGETKHLAVLDDKVSLHFSGVNAGNLYQVLADFTGIKVEVPAPYRDSVLTLNVNDLSAFYSLFYSLGLNGLHLQDTGESQVSLLVTPAENSCFTAFNKPVLHAVVSRRNVEDPEGADPRRRELLELYEAQELAFKGYIHYPTRPENQQYEVFVRTPDGSVDRVFQGRRIGKNFGKIRSISLAGVEVDELFLDKKSEWISKKSTWPLIGQPPGQPTAAH